MIGEIAGGLIGAGVSAYGQARQLKWEKEKAHNAHQWEVADLKKAGLNPILSAGGTGASTGSIGGIEGNAITEGINSAFANKIAKENLKLQNKKVKSEIRNSTALADAQVAQSNANTARILELLPEEKKTMQRNRTSYLERELLAPSWKLSEIGSDLAKEIKNKITSAHKNMINRGLKHNYAIK